MFELSLYINDEMLSIKRKYFVDGVWTCDIEIVQQLYEAYALLINKVAIEILAADNDDFRKCKDPSDVRGFHNMSLYLRFFEIAKALRGEHTDYFLQKKVALFEKSYAEFKSRLEEQNYPVHTIDMQHDNVEWVVYCWEFILERRRAYAITKLIMDFKDIQIVGKSD